MNPCSNDFNPSLRQTVMDPSLTVMDPSLNDIPNEILLNKILPSMTMDSLFLLGATNTNNASLVLEELRRRQPGLLEFVPRDRAQTIAHFKANDLIGCYENEKMNLERVPYESVEAILYAKKEWATQLVRGRQSLLHALNKGAQIKPGMMLETLKIVMLKQDFITSVTSLKLENPDKLPMRLPPEIGVFTRLKVLGHPCGDHTNYAEIGALTLFSGWTEIPSQIGQCTALKRLGLQSGFLTALPPEIAKCRNLKVLNVGNNFLSVLPLEIGRCYALRQLHIPVNRLTKLPDTICGLTNLKRLGVSHNKLTELPSEIAKLENLNELNVSHNKFEELTAEIGYLRSMLFLFIEFNQLKELPKEIGLLKNLFHLSLGGNKLSVEHLKYLKELLTKVSNK